MTIARITPGQPHPLGWVPSRLRLGDELGDQPRIGHFPALEHNLQRLYRLTPQQLVEGNGVAFTSPTIDAWVLRTGGIKLSNGQPVFSDASVIFLPPGGPRPPVKEQPQPARSGLGLLGWFLVAAGAWAASEVL